MKPKLYYLENSRRWGLEYFIRTATEESVSSGTFILHSQVQSQCYRVIYSKKEEYEFFTIFHELLSADQQFFKLLLSIYLCVPF